jgi:ectoine hydroxylase-related dioxygenase (phytanoyl-CoA dioxygenase family)
LKDILLKANARAVAQQLLGPPVEAQGEFAIMKPPQLGAPAPWHQDESYWKEELEYNSVSIWVPLQEATLENGCMQFIPGSHKGDVLPHHPIGHERRSITAARCTTLGRIALHRCAGPTCTPLPLPS